MSPPLAETALPPGSLEHWLVQYSPYLIAGIMVLTAGGMLLLGQMSIRSGLRAKRIAHSMHQFPSVIGAVVSSAVEPRSVKGNLYHVPQIEFTYQVDGRTYRSMNILPGPFVESLDRPWAESWVEAFPVERQIEVFYDPRRPQTCVVERLSAHVPLEAGTNIGIGLVLIAVGLIVLYLAFALVLPEARKWPDALRKPPAEAALAP